MNKKVTIGGKPTAKATQTSADTWVETRNLSGEQPPTKRLTIDIHAALHRAIKMQCAMRGTKVSEEIRELLLQKYGKP